MAPGATNAVRYHSGYRGTPRRCPARLGQQEAPPERGLLTSGRQDLNLRPPGPQLSSGSADASAVRPRRPRRPRPRCCWTHLDRDRVPPWYRLGDAGTPGTPGTHGLWMSGSADWRLRARTSGRPRAGANITVVSPPDHRRITPTRCPGRPARVLSDVLKGGSGTQPRSRGPLTSQEPLMGIAKQLLGLLREKRRTDPAS